MARFFSKKNLKICNFSSKKIYNGFFSPFKKNLKKNLTFVKIVAKKRKGCLQMKTSIVLCIFSLYVESNTHNINK